MAKKSKCWGRYYDFRSKNPHLFMDRVIQNFFLLEDNIQLLNDSIEGDNKSLIELNERFRKFFFHIRFKKYMISVIKFCTIDQLRQNFRYDTRNQLIFDIPINGDLTIGEFLLNKKERHVSNISTWSNTQISFTNEYLQNAYEKLTVKQRLVTSLCYLHCYHDNEIAKMTGTSPQAVNKTRLLALKKLRYTLIKRGES